MDFRSWSVIYLVILISTLIVVLPAIALHRSRLKKFHAHAEYWVYTSADSLPDQDEMMKRLIGDNPYILRGQNPIGPAEGLMFSDVRLKIALALRSKNPNLFDPRSLPESIPDHHEFVADVGNFKSIIRLQYGSPVKLKDKRHLQFLLHAADAMAEISGATWIFDKITGSLRTKDELGQVLKENFNATKIELHVRLAETEEQTFRSFGLVKIGIPDFETHTVPTDQMQLVQEVLEKYMSLSWERGEAFPDPISAYGDEFILLQKRIRPTLTEMRIVRKQMI